MPTSEDWVEQESNKIMCGQQGWVLIVVVSHDQPCSGETRSLNRKWVSAATSWPEVFWKYKVAGTVPIQRKLLKFCSRLDRSTAAASPLVIFSPWNYPVLVLQRSMHKCVLVPINNKIRLTHAFSLQCSKTLYSLQMIKLATTLTQSNIWRMELTCFVINAKCSSNKHSYSVHVPTRILRVSMECMAVERLLRYSINVVHVWLYIYKMIVHLHLPQQNHYQ